MNTPRLVLFALLSLGFLAGCGGDGTEDRSEPVVAVTMDELFPRLAGGTFIYYLKGSNTPYTGKVFGWHENGQKRYEGDFKDGEKVEGSDKYWNNKGKGGKNNWHNNQGTSNKNILSILIFQLIFSIFKIL